MSHATANTGSTCSMCCALRPLVDSHIIPRSFWDLKNTGAPVRTIDSTAKTPPRRAWTGPYDQIVCEECERLFGRYDEYAAGALLRRLPDEGAPEYMGAELLAHSLPTYDYDLLQLFFASLLWRASVSRLPFFERVDAGPHLPALGAAIRAGDPSQCPTLEVLLGAYPEFGHTLSPHRHRLEALNITRFCLNRFVVDLKLDQRGLPDPLSHVMLRPNAPLVVLARDPLPALRLARDAMRQNLRYLRPLVDRMR